MFTVNETFRSIQGEGLLAGTPSIFIRTQGCLLRCSFCDTKYAWEFDKDVGPDGWKLEDDNQIDFFINELPLYKDIKNFIVITGGEPLAEQNLPILRTLVKKLIEKRHHLTFETTTLINPKTLFNKTIFQTILATNRLFGVDEYRDEVIYSVSPKYPVNCYPFNANEESILNYYQNKHEGTARLMKRIMFYKFVYHKTYEEFLKKMIDRLHPTLHERIFFMPLTPNKWNEDLYKKSCEETVNACMKYGVRYSPRIHTDLWQLKRGV